MRLRAGARGDSPSPHPLPVRTGRGSERTVRPSLRTSLRAARLNLSPLFCGERSDRFGAQVRA
ncbi:hypothetical protein BF49_2947 [Bradyrhizobium sp.]|nr:hypothetical protein BF49_2947 [Bradyrhizobium sp.]